MPAPAVIPAPIAYVKFAAVKKLVVGFLGVFALLTFAVGRPSHGRCCSAVSLVVKAASL